MLTPKIGNLPRLTTSVGPAITVEFVDLLEDPRNVIAKRPAGVSPLELGEIADVPDVITAPIVIGVFQVHLPPAYLFAQLDGFEHRAVALPASTHVVHLGRDRVLEH